MCYHIICLTFNCILLCIANKLVVNAALVSYFCQSGSKNNSIKKQGSSTVLPCGSITFPCSARLEVKKTGQYFTVEDRERRREGEKLVLVNDIGFRPRVKNIQNVKSMLGECWDRISGVSVESV